MILHVLYYTFPCLNIMFDIVCNNVWLRYNSFHSKARCKLKEVAVGASVINVHIRVVMPANRLRVEDSPHRVKCHKIVIFFTPPNIPPQWYKVI